MPLKSDPTEVDSDGDGLLDSEDEKPFINDYKTLWSKVTDGNDIYYFGQLNYSEDSFRIIKYDTTSGKTIVNTYSDGLKEVTDKEFDIENLKISQEISEASATEDGQVTLDLDSRDQNMMVNLDLFKGFATQIVEENFEKEEVEDFYSTEGILLGVIDSCLSSSNIGVSFPCNIRGDKTINFLIQGFGDNSWPVDCRYDLPSIIEDIHYYISNKITSNNYNFQLRFDEQGIQRYIDVKDMGEEVELVCHSYLEWIPVPDSLQMKKDEFRRKIIRLYNNFIVFALELCPLLIGNPMLSDWKPIKSGF